jgi:hypothetical protein
MSVDYAGRTRELLGQSQQALWCAMYYVRNWDLGFYEDELRGVIHRVEKLQAKIIARSDEKQLKEIHDE